MTFSNTYRKLGRLTAVGLAAFALAAPAAYGMIPDDRFTSTPIELTSGASAHPDNRPVRPSGPATVTPSSDAAGDSWPFESFGSPLLAPNQVTFPGVQPGFRGYEPYSPTNGFYNSPVASAPIAAPDVAPAPVDVVQPVTDTGTDWRTVSIALSGVLAALLAGMLGVGIVRRSRQHAQLS